jgi:inositol phosphorylceramide mannosyltransferase catalytic subunit
MECLRPSEVIFNEYNLTTIPYHKIPKEPPSSITKDRAVFLGRMGKDDGFSDSIPNAWMASAPGHPFWYLPLNFVLDKYNGSTNGAFLSMGAESLTGPIALREMVIKYNADFKGDKAKGMDELVAQSPLNDVHGAHAGEPHRVEILPHQIIYPYSWTDEDDDKREFCWAKLDTYDKQKCKESLHLKLQGSVAITYWTHSW